MRKLTVGMYVFWFIFAITFVSQVKAGEIYVYAGQFEYPNADAGAPLDVASASNPRRYANFTTVGGKSTVKVPIPLDMASIEHFTTVELAFTTSAVGATGNCGFKICLMVPQDGESENSLSFPPASCGIASFGASIPAQYVRKVINLPFGVVPTDASGADCDTATNSCKGLMGTMLVERDETFSTNSASDCAVSFVHLVY